MASRLEVTENEVFPVYDIVPRETPSHVDPEVTLTEEELADYNRVSEEWEAWQERLMYLRNPAGGHQPPRAKPWRVI